MLATDKTGLILPTFFAIIIHELGHLFAMWTLDCAPKQIKLIPASIQITSEFSKRYRNDAIIAFCGPAINLVLFITLYFNYLAFQNKMVLYYALLNLIVAIFNLLPISELDGGTILFSFLVKKMDYSRARLIIKFITLAVSVIIIIAAVTLTIRRKINISLYIIGIYLFIINLIKN